MTNVVFEKEKEKKSKYWHEWVAQHPDPEEDEKGFEEEENGDDENGE